jgi:hypothetical protein
VQVGFPDDWQVSGPKRDEIIALLDNVPAEKAAVQEKGGVEPWYVKLTAQQITECKQDPQLCVVRLCLSIRMTHASCELGA